MSVGQASEIWPPVSNPAAILKNGAKDAALIVALEKYPFVSNIPGAVQNGEDWYRYITKIYGVPATNTILLRNQDGTKEDILGAAKRVAQKVKVGGTIWLVFIGHGAPSPDNDDGLLLGIDVRQRANSLRHRGIKQNDILQLLNQGKQRQTVAIIDACFSGKNNQGREMVKGLQPLIVAKAKPPRKTIVLSAGRADQFAGSLPHLERPAFSYLVLGGLRGWADSNRNRKVTVNEVIEYTNDVFQVIPLGRNQNPQRHGNKSFVLSRLKRIEKGPDLVDINLRLNDSKPFKSAGLIGKLLRRDTTNDRIADKKRSKKNHKASKKKTSSANIWQTKKTKKKSRKNKRPHPKNDGSKWSVGGDIRMMYTQHNAVNYQFETIRTYADADADADGDAEFTNNKSLQVTEESRTRDTQSSLGFHISMQKKRTDTSSLLIHVQWLTKSFSRSVTSTVSENTTDYAEKKTNDKLGSTMLRRNIPIDSKQTLDNFQSFEVDCLSPTNSPFCETNTSYNLTVDERYKEHLVYVGYDRWLLRALGLDLHLEGQVGGNFFIYQNQFHKIQGLDPLIGAEAKLQKGLGSNHGKLQFSYQMLGIWGMGPENGLYRQGPRLFNGFGFGWIQEI